MTGHSEEDIDILPNKEVTCASNSIRVKRLEREDYWCRVQFIPMVLTDYIPYCVRAVNPNYRAVVQRCNGARKAALVALRTRNFCTDNTS